MSKKNSKNKRTKKNARAEHPAEPELPSKQDLQKGILMVEAMRAKLAETMDTLGQEGQHYMVTTSSSEHAPLTSIMNMHPADWLIHRASLGFDAGDIVFHLVLPVTPLQSLKLQTLFLHED